MKKKKNQFEGKNYLDLVPEHNPSMKWHEDRNGRIVLEVENTGAINRIAQEIFHKPRYTKVHLDEMGTFIWPLIDGKRTVADIADMVKEHFGEKAEPLYPRIVKYFQIVESYHFIGFEK